MDVINYVKAVDNSTGKGIKKGSFYEVVTYVPSLKSVSGQMVVVFDDLEDIRGYDASFFNTESHF